MEQRKELAFEHHDLPSRFWEPQPDEEDLERMREENERQIREWEQEQMEETPLPFL